MDKGDDKKDPGRGRLAYSGRASDPGSRSRRRSRSPPARRARRSSPLSNRGRVMSRLSPPRSRGQDATLLFSFGKEAPTSFLFYHLLLLTYCWPFEGFG